MRGAGSGRLAENPDLLLRPFALHLHGTKLFRAVQRRPASQAFAHGAPGVLKGNLGVEALRHAVEDEGCVLCPAQGRGRPGGRVHGGHVEHLVAEGAVVGLACLDGSLQGPLQQLAGLFLRQACFRRREPGRPEVGFETDGAKGPAKGRSLVRHGAERQKGRLGVLEPGVRHKAFERDMGWRPFNDAAVVYAKLRQLGAGRIGKIRRPAQQPERGLSAGLLFVDGRIPGKAFQFRMQAEVLQHGLAGAVERDLGVELGRDALEGVGRAVLPALGARRPGGRVFGKGFNQGRGDAGIAASPQQNQGLQGLFHQQGRRLHGVDVMGRRRLQALALLPAFGGSLDNCDDENDGDNDPEPGPDYAGDEAGKEEKKGGIALHKRGKDKSPDPARHVASSLTSRPRSVLLPPWRALAHGRAPQPTG